MPTSLLAFLITLRSLIRSRIDLQLENLALRHQIGVLQLSLKKRPKLTAGDRLFWMCLSTERQTRVPTELPTMAAVAA